MQYPKLKNFGQEPQVAFQAIHVVHGTVKMLSWQIM
jgi:hypothetical protein